MKVRLIQNSCNWLVILMEADDLQHFCIRCPNKLGKWRFKAVRFGQCFAPLWRLLFCTTIQCKNIGSEEIAVEAYVETLGTLLIPWPQVWMIRELQQQILKSSFLASEFWVQIYHSAELDSLMIDRLTGEVSP